MFIRHVTYFGQPLAVMCDGRCDKAWGFQARPLRDGKTRDDDWEREDFARDDELDVAPLDPGTYEGGDCKPRPGWPKLCNKWCIRECERCTKALPINNDAVPYRDLAAAKGEGDAE